ncbi:related to 5`-3` DNA helicase [Phialocephala subalpina]|uniref:ATP-dependent DNA helicase n=1 Tax=Phialocephala subalpina TaxID=576137 RepID=A0A1L7XUL4_9HELO|nr:related to 5`-3` DNA helicase [Phialocephala subalpina]
MAKKTKVAYVVFHGKRTGIFSTWAECEAQVKGFPKASFQGYETQREADDAWRNRSSTVQTNPPSQAAKPGSIEGHLQEIEPNKSQVGKHQHNDKSNLKRPSAVTDLTLSDGDEPLEQPPAKKIRTSPIPHIAGKDEQGEEDDLEPVVLTSEQQAVVDMALGGKNIFLTGAAGSGKTVTLKEILRRFDKRGVKYQVVAPTGIAALPLGGKTTYSFLGLKPDSLHLSIEKLLEGIKPNTRENAMPVRVLVVEEISMVENQFLERMSLILQQIRAPNLPFGGMQVIFLGDFHQLPPVKPFEHCLPCGKLMSKQPPYECEDCTPTKQAAFKDKDKWAFKAAVWTKLNLRMVYLQQIHRQKAGQFQNILNKIRDGIDKLSDEEWNALEAKKTFPEGIRAVKLMSLRRSVEEVNTRELRAISAPTRMWESYDSYAMVESDPFRVQRPWEQDQPLKQHRLAKKLTLKISAKVILLTNYGSDGLVNGSQGEVIDFRPHDPKKDEEDIPKGNQSDEWALNAFSEMNACTKDHLLEDPIVRFSNGTVRRIKAITSTTRYGTNLAPYRASRTQFPLALAWALSIHKSQGMTLDYVEVSSRYLFESGQLYVALSRATSLEGLTVTGFSRKQIGVDPEVVKFYKNTNWETFSSTPPKHVQKLTPLVGRETIYLD